MRVSQQCFVIVFTLTLLLLSNNVRAQIKEHKIFSYEANVETVSRLSVSKKGFNYFGIETSHGTYVDFGSLPMVGFIGLTIGYRKMNSILHLDTYGNEIHFNPNDLYNLSHNICLGGQFDFRFNQIRKLRKKIIPAISIKLQSFIYQSNKDKELSLSVMKS